MDGRVAGPPHVEIGSPRELPEALRALGVPGGRPVLACVGGAGGMSERDEARVEDVVRERLVPVLQRCGAAVVDGGTDAGVMRILGAARAATGASFPLVGVAALGTVRLPGRPVGGPDAAELESRHTGVVLVPGRAWGEESPWIADVVGVLARGHPSATLVINGGVVTYRDVGHSVAAGRPVLVVQGTGRAADDFAAALAGRPGDLDDRLDPIVASGLVSAVALDDPAGLAAAVEAALT